MMTSGALENVIDRLIFVVPELGMAYEDYCAEWKDDLPGPYNVAIDVIMPSVEKWIDEPKNNQDVLSRFFKFVEELAVDREWAVRNFAQIGIINPIHADSRRLPTAQAFMGPGALEMLSRSGTVG